MKIYLILLLTFFEARKEWCNIHDKLLKDEIIKYSPFSISQSRESIEDSCNTEKFFFKIFSTSSTAWNSTLLVGIGVISSINQVINSSLSVSQLCLHGKGGNALFNVQHGSKCRIYRCIIHLREYSKEPIYSSCSALEFVNLSLSFFSHKNIASNSMVNLWNESSLIVQSSSFSSIVVQMSNPLLASGDFDCVQTSDCFFKNISHLQTTDKEHQLYLKSKESIVFGCNFLGVENPFCSVLTIGGYTSSFFCLNSSFLACTVTEQNRQVFSSSDGDVVIEQTTFNVETSQPKGGTICASNTKSFTIKNCFFDRCNNTHPNGYGGVIHMTDVGPLLIQNCTAEKCNAIAQEGVMRIENLFSSVTVTDMNSTECEGAYRGVGLIAGSSSPVCCTSLKMIKSKSRIGEAGAIALYQTFSSFIAIDWLCDSNSAVNVGGAIFVMRDISGSVNPVSFRYSFFINNTAPKGTDIAFTDHYFNLTNSSCFQLCFSQSNQNRVWMCTSGFRSCSSGEERNAFLPNPSGNVIYVNPERTSGDIDGCGDVSNECHTVCFSCCQWINSYHKTVKLYSGEYSESSFSVGFQHMTIEKNTSSSSVKIFTNPSSGAFCTLLGGSLDMRGMQIIHSSTSSPDKCIFSENNEYSVLVLNECSLKAESTSSAFSAPFFLLTKGEARLESCEISSVVFESTSLFTTEKQAHLALSNVKISMISRKIGNGSVFSKAVQAEESFVLSNVSMKNCKCLDGNGGALYLELNALSNAQIGVDSDCLFDTCTVPTDSQKKRKGGGIYIHVMEGADDFQLKMLQFSNCNGWKGKKVFIESKNLSKVINTATLAFNPSVAVDSTDLDELSGTENVDQNIVIPLVVFLRNFSSPAYVSGQTTDSDYRLCGYRDYPCQSVEGASAARFTNAKRIIRFLPSFSFRKETLLNSQSYAFDVEEDNTPINIGSSQVKENEGLLINSVETSFSRIKFVLEASLNGRSAFILSNANVLSMSNCEAIPAVLGASISYCLVKITNGKLSISNFAVPLAQKLNFDNEPFVAISGSASADFNSLDMNGMTTSCSNGLISVDSGNITTINNSTFRNSNLTSSAFIVSSSGTYLLTIKNSTFEDIKRTTGNGSCVNLNGRNSYASSFTASNCTFTRCKVTENGKGGGAIATHLNSQTALILELSTFTSCQAPKPNLGSSGKGGAIQIIFDEANAKFVLSKSLSFISNTAEHGDDVFACSLHLEWCVISTTFQFFNQEAPFSLESCAGIDSQWPNVIIPLVFYLLPRKAGVYVSKEGNDVSVCGFAEYACKTIEFSMFQSEDSVQLIILPNYEFEEVVSLSSANEILIEGKALETKMKMIGTQSSTANAMITVSQTSTFRYLDFYLQPSIPSLQSSVFLECSANVMLHLEDCSALTEQGEEKCSFGFLVVAEGSFAMTRFTINSIGFQSVEVIKVHNEGSGSIDSCTWTNVTSAVDTGIISYSSAGTLNIRNTTINQSASSCCSFVEDKHGKSLVVENNTLSGIIKNEGNGSVIKAEIGESESLELNDISVDCCSSVSGCGGGVFISTSSSAKVRIGKEGTTTSFARCSAKGTLPECGFGGGIFLKHADCLADLVLAAMSFGTEGDGTSNEAEGGGSNVFVEGYNLDKIITNQSFKFDINKESTAEFGKLCSFEDGNISYAIPLVVFLLTFEPPAIVGGSFGFDYRMCGVSIYPCATIPFAISKRFPAPDSSGASIRLTADFSFKSAILFNTQPTEVIAEQIGAVFDVRSDGVGEGAGLLFSSVNVKFSEIVFGLPCSFEEPSRTSLFLCSSATLTIDRCEFQNSSSSAVEYRIIYVTNGKVELNGCSINELAMGNAEIIALDGSNAECAIEGIETSILSKEGDGALILVARGKKLNIENSSIENVTLPNSNHISINSLSNGFLKNITFGNLTRTNGDGAVISGGIGSNEELEVENCLFSRCSCYSARTIGGCVLMDVEEGGVFRFERNKVEFCIVSSGDGFGGGLFLTFASSHIDYSMRNNTFENNGAFRGKDAYVVCEEPGALIVLMYWNGSVSEEAAPERFWVRSPFESIDGGSTMIDFLFPPQTSFVFVDGAVSAVENCGPKRNPCASVELGFQKMDSSHSIIQLEGNTPIDAIVNRHGISLTVQSNTTTKAMIFGRNGKFELVEGTRSTTLTFSKLCFVLPSSPNPSPEMSSLVEVSIGQCSFLDCTFEQGSSSNSNPSKWIASGEGGVVHFASCTLGGIPFQSGGIASIEVHVSGACTFDGCSSIKGDGGILNCILEAEGSLIVNKTSIVTCEVNQINGRGGGIYFDLKGSTNNYLFSGITFSRNEAFEGKDMFVRCADLNASIIPSLFDFEYFGEDERPKVDLKGRDETHFMSASADLLYFLVKFSSSTISVGSAGIDFIGCGKAETPCHSLWRGVNNLEASSESQTCSVEVMDEVLISECFAFELAELQIGFSSSAALRSFAKLIVSQTASGSNPSIFSSRNSLTFSLVEFHLPSLFTSGQSALFSSTDGYLTLNSTFLCSNTTVLEYILLLSKGGTVQLLNVSISSVTFSSCPIALSSYVTLENCCFRNINTPSSIGGGAVSANLERSDLLRVKNCETELCKCSIKNGKGGFLYADCSKSTATAPLRFEGEMTFERNDAQLGKNIFIASTELNSSVTLTAFAFSFESMKEDSNAFVGIEGESEELDLFRYLVSYHAASIFLSEDGEDVMRCGSTDDPCRTFWKGMQQIDEEEIVKVIIINRTTPVANTFNLSSFTIRSSSLDEDEDYKSILSFREKSGEMSDPFLRCEGELSLKLITLVIESSFNNSASELILCENGALSFEKCSFETEGISSGKREILCNFVTCIKGKLLLAEVSMESASIGKSSIAIGSVTCIANNFTCTFVNISDGSIFEFVESIEMGKGMNSDEKSKFLMNESVITSVTRADNGASVIDCQRDRDISIDVSGTTLSDCKAVESQKGGVAFIKLPEEGSFSVLNSTMIRCCCSNEGKGGAFYIDATGSGSLHFLFQSATFTGNTAKVGNDIYVSCHNISEQINETQFKFDLREGIYVRQNAIYGMDKTDHREDTNLLDFITIYQADTIIVSSLHENRGRNDRQCGTYALPCLSLDYAIAHVTADFESHVVVDGASVIESEIGLDNVLLSSRSRYVGNVTIHSIATGLTDAVVTTLNAVSIMNLCFSFEADFLCPHSTFISPQSGIVELTNCSFSSAASLPLRSLFDFSKGNGSINSCIFNSLILRSSVIEASASCSVMISFCQFGTINSGGTLINCEKCRDLLMMHTSFANNSLSLSSANVPSLLAGISIGNLTLSNCSFIGKKHTLEKGILAVVSQCPEVLLDLCTFNGCNDFEMKNERSSKTEELCNWNGSLIDMQKSRVVMKDTTIANSSDGGASVEGGSVVIEKGEFVGNNPWIVGYTSARRNIVCREMGEVNVMSVKGGDGQEKNGSLWMLNEGCTLSGIVEERKASLFVPTLESVAVEEEGAELKVTFKGQLLLPCNLSFRVVAAIRSEALVVRYEFESEGFVSEDEAWGKIPSKSIREAEEEAEVSASILFGEKEAPSSTEAIILKNKSEPQSKGDNIVAEGGKEEKSSWAVICVIFVVLFVIVLVGFIVFVVRWRKWKEEAQKYKEIVEDTVKKDPKAFEMVTMEMSPEEQWRRAEREAEKKNDERMKKRVYENSLGHSESSEHLLSESGSTEYILGRDSDKIPDWALEKEEEETRKQTPSPSISSTSTTSTTDSDSTFVRGEDMCPTTSSMSNLVDAMACSSPHEKLIVDLRDSLFMLLHGKNEKKEMAIGSLKEREMTTAQILFWVANLALHSFDEMDNPLSSLTNLSPHIVLFSEHMVICIVMHSDLLSDDDSDSTSISSSTVVTSASDDDEEDSLPSSAFEDEDYYKKECLRWKAPELLMNKNMGATKQSVAFSIGMMLWECLTLQIPFGDYEAVTAGDKITKGERPNASAIRKSVFFEAVKVCLSGEASARPTLVELKRLFIQHFPKGAAMLTISDAIDFEDESEEKENSKVSLLLVSGSEEVDKREN
ncbi:uncharacterized protein MONOS_9996 [Monocercomonoides exilis]|uniref:uncharacterized protein n=1 Tax=Monocercomonoides exilis TaxID=2049356 RepID=UPI00355AC8E1|nr:hypothetical protein MONOS_9996 [Monocercomonoides exilis]|eukprot:MONOS_9996.1-p1 / transcript=MONOS_9996.1 / gene=MONOS_9996 / organism=Monocercomonoides_exilis_PA203 / gene_product=unspecified product / transcript_product=unspecified product / location=Mono_scaffold00435:8902-21127(+) / protein_length=4020 / sequence_SO=supercontig / SO=protein_coding / is_pseudo=false